jgi:hypothetical protein
LKMFDQASSAVSLTLEGVLGGHLPKAARCCSVEEGMSVDEGRC